MPKPVWDSSFSPSHLLFTFQPIAFPQFKADRSSPQRTQSFTSKAAEFRSANFCLCSRFGAFLHRNVHLTLRRPREGCLCFGMNRCWKVLLCILLLSGIAIAAS